MSHPLEAALSRNYVPPGPVARAFIEDTTTRLVGIMGPNGSGKTSSCPIKAQVITRLQPRNKHDGVIRSQGYVIRRTYPDLWGKTIPQWKKVFPDCKDWPFSGQVNRPARQVVRWREPWRGRMQDFEMIVNFVAIGDANLEDFARGLLATWIWLNEADTMPDDSPDFLLGRLGRFPEADQVADGERQGPGCVMCDFNAPNTTNWTYTRIVMGRLLSGRASNAKCYIQPSGLAPNAENPTLRKIQPDYYATMAADMEDWQRKRFIENKPGYARDGEPIYGDEFDYETFVLTQGARQPARGYPILIGVDGGLTAAAVLGQRDHRGQAVVLRSLVTERGKVTDANTFGQNLKGLLAGEFSGCPAVVMMDPANVQQKVSAGGLDATGHVTTWAIEFTAGCGLPVIPAPTNKIGRRLRAVKNLLRGRVGAEPTLLINEFGNEDLVEGFVAGYRIDKLAAGKGEEYKGAPAKNHASHVHDALQYFAFLAGGDPDYVDMAILLQAEILQQQRSLKMGGSGRPQVIHD